MKTIPLAIQTSVTATYDKTKTTIAGHVSQKTINSQSVLGPVLTSFVDCQTQATTVPGYMKYNPNTGRLFVLSTITASPTILLFNVSSTGVQTYVGKIIVTLANAAVTTHTASGIEVDDNNSNFQIIIATRGSVVINGGIFLVSGITFSDFTPAGQTIWAAQTTGQKGVYFLQDDLYKGVNHNITTAWGITKLYSSPNSALNTKLYCLNNTVALPQVVSFELATTPAVANTTTGISSQTTLYAGTSPSAFFTSGANNPNMSANDPVILTGVVPASFTSSPLSAVQIVYFIRDIQLISGQYYFNLSTTSAGAAAVPGSSVSGTANIMRAFGTCTNLFYGRTPITGLAPALTGTLLQSNIVDHARPTSVPLNSALNGQDCLALATTTNLYLGKVTDLFTEISGTSSASTIIIAGLPTLSLGMSVTGPGITPGSTVTSFGNNGVNSNVTLSSPVITAQASSVTFVLGATSWSSLTTSNALGTGQDIVAPTISMMKYSDLLDRFIYVTNSSTCVIKQLKNNEITGKLGNLDVTWLEAPSTLPAVFAGLVTTAGLEVQGGMVFLSGSSVGQRGVVFIDLYSDHLFGNSYIVTPIQSVTTGSTLKYITTLEQFYDYTNTMNFYIRSASTSTDAIFNTVAGGWAPISKAVDISYGLSNPYFQIKGDFNVLGALNTSGSQLQDIILTILDPNEISVNWEGSVDNTSRLAASPAYTAFRLLKAYSSTVPTLYYRAYDDSGNLVVSADTSTNPTMFEYSTNNGLTWNALGTIPNTALTTEVRYKWASPPGVIVTSSIRES